MPTQKIRNLNVNSDSSIFRIKKELSSHKLFDLFSSQNWSLRLSVSQFCDEGKDKGVVMLECVGFVTFSKIQREEIKQGN